MFVIVKYVKTLKIFNRLKAPMCVFAIAAVFITLRRLGRPDGDRLWT